MALLKGIERCQFISNIVDGIDELIWVKDREDNLIYANSAAFNFFKNVGAHNEFKCPIDNIPENEINREVCIKVEGNGFMWLRFSSMVIHDEEIEGNEGILIIASDITKEKERDIEISNKLDEKINAWKREKDAKVKVLKDRNSEIFKMLNLDKTEQEIWLI